MNFKPCVQWLSKMIKEVAQWIRTIFGLRWNSLLTFYEDYRHQKSSKSVDERGYESPINLLSARSSVPNFKFSFSHKENAKLSHQLVMIAEYHHSVKNYPKKSHWDNKNSKTTDFKIFLFPRRKNILKRASKLSKTFRDFHRLSETFRDFQRLSETSKNFQRLQDTFNDFQKLSETDI